MIAGDYDFQKTDMIMPHPIYGWMSWVCVLNPSFQTFEVCKDLLNSAYDKAIALTQKKILKIKCYTD